MSRRLGTQPVSLVSGPDPIRYDDGMLDLPAPYLRIAPELDGVSWPGEVLATCASCAMQRSVPGHIRFTAKARCCTYQPRLPNFSVGRILRRDDVGAERIRTRLLDLRAVDARGIGARPDLAARYATRADDDFGHNDLLTCPYWVEGPLGCSIHADRNAVCRTWYCKSAQGARGGLAWSALKETLRSIEHTLAELCIRDGEPPVTGDGVEAWVHWFRWCADHVDALPDDRIEALRGERLAGLLAQVAERCRQRDLPLPDVVIPHVMSWVVRDDRIDMTAWSPYDMVPLPKWIFHLLSKLNGERTWWEARALAEVELGVVVSDDLVLTLWRRGLIGPPIDLTDIPVNPEIEFG